MKNYSFKDMDIYLGIDVHKNSWEVKLMTKHASLKRLHIRKPSTDFLVSYLHKHYPEGNYKSVYEAGFSGFWIQEELNAKGIETIIVHPGDVPTTDKEKRFKDDGIDCEKLANSLRAGQISGVYIPPKQLQRDRSIIRQRYQYASDERRTKNRIKSHLAFYGISVNNVDEEQYWSNRYIFQLEEYACKEKDTVLLQYLERLRLDRNLVLKSTRQVRVLSKTNRYHKQVEYLRTLPGVGLLTVMVYLTEIGNLNRFPKDDHYIAYVGFVPTRRSSGDKTSHGKLSKRGNKRVRTALIQSAWMAMRNDPYFSLLYERHRASGKPPQKAIVLLARKLALIMKALLRDKTKYNPKME